YDKIFSTFMFRRVSSIYGQIGALRRFYGSVVGLVTDWKRAPLRGMQVYLQDAKGHALQTSASRDGSYVFSGLMPGKYTVIAGDKRSAVTVGEKPSLLNPETVDLSGVRRVLDLASAPVWEVADALRLPVDLVHKIRRALPS